MTRLIQSRLARVVSKGTIEIVNVPNTTVTINKLDAANAGATVRCEITDFGRQQSCSWPKDGRMIMANLVLWHHAGHIHIKRAGSTGRV